MKVIRILGRLVYILFWLIVGLFFFFAFSGVAGLFIGYVFEIEDEMTCVLCGIVACVACCVVPWLKEKLDDMNHKNSVSHSSSRSSSSSSWYSDYDYTPSRSREEDDILDDVSKAIRITEHYGEDWTGYDPESPQPQPWDEDW